jgi:hypothetical protein
VRDLFAHKDAIFGELKRASTLTHSASGAQRPRAISTDESNRRANMEERQRAIAAQRSPRATSPGANRASGSHRRDRSQTRFPVNTSSPTETRKNTLNRSSLEVPGDPDSPTPAETTTNGNTDAAPVAPVPFSPVVEHPAPSSTRVPFPRKTAGGLSRSNNRDSTGSLRGEDAAPRGVTLEDKPMDD